MLDRDYFTVPAEQIRKVRPVLTMVNGVIAHETPGVLGPHGGRTRDWTGQVDTRGRWDRA